MSFEEALDLGLINYIYEPEHCWEEVIELRARQFCPPNRGIQDGWAYQRDARCNRASEVAFSEALAIGQSFQQLCFQSEDAKEGLAAYNEKRPFCVSMAGRQRQTKGRSLLSLSMSGPSVDGSMSGR